MTTLPNGRTHIHAAMETVDAYVEACRDYDVAMKKWNALGDRKNMYEPPRHRFHLLEKAREEWGGYQWRDEIISFWIRHDAALDNAAMGAGGDDVFAANVWDSWDYGFVPWVAEHLMLPYNDGIHLRTNYIDLIRGEVLHAQLMKQATENENRERSNA